MTCHDIAPGRFNGFRFAIDDNDDGHLRFRSVDFDKAVFNPDHQRLLREYLLGKPLERIDAACILSEPRLKKLDARIKIAEAVRELQNIFQHRRNIGPQTRG
jgi:hypothetical protein